MDNINEDIVCEIVSYLDAVSISRFLRTSKRLWHVFKKQRVMDLLIPYQKFIQYQQWNKGLYEAVKRNNIPQIEVLVGADHINYKEAATLAAFHGNMSLVDYFSKFGDIHWPHVFRKACEGGHKVVAERLAEKYPEPLKGHQAEDYLVFRLSKQKREQEMKLLLEASNAGDKDATKNTINYLLSKSNPFFENLDLVMRAGNLEVIQYAFQQAREPMRWSFMNLAALHNQKHIIDWLIEQGCIAWNQGMLGAAKGGHLELVEFFDEKGASCAHQAFWEVCQRGHIHLLDYFQNKYILDEVIGAGLAEAAEQDHRELILRLLEQYVTQADLNKTLCSAAEYGHKSLMELS